MRPDARARGPVRIKICGVTHPEHVDAAAEHGADLVGLVLWPHSPRAIEFDAAVDLAAHASSRGLETVALVVDPADALRRSIEECRAFDRIQFHGQEACERLAGCSLPTIKGFAFSPEALAAWRRCAAATWLLVDGPRGGGGERFDHDALRPLVADLDRPWLLAGGLTPETVATAIARTRPFGVDVSSGVERERGVKDPARIAAFCDAVRTVGS